MEIVKLLVWKILTMFMVMGIGAYLYRKKVISDRTTEELGKVLIQVVLPSVVLSQMWTEYSAEKQQTVIRCFVLGMLAQILAVGAAWIRFRRDDEAASKGCSAFSNVGFFGIPVVTAVMGSSAVFYLSPTMGTAESGADLTCGRTRPVLSQDSPSGDRKRCFVSAESAQYTCRSAALRGVPGKERSSRRSQEA